jgi:2-keto-4-pentenoate hydratase/2-oxohepta-3-ene-1,7-dioic acid hydratase in catechol pathway
MKLLRYGDVGREQPGVLDASGTIRDLSGIVSDIAGEALLPESIHRLRGIDVRSLPRVPGSPRIGPCVGRVGKFIAIGLNYSDHAAESGMAVPAEPIVFMKATSCIMGPCDDIVIPRGSLKTDWEVELGIVIGKPAKYVDESDAFDHIAGFCVINDISERKFQLEGTGQWVKGKSADSFGPIGPWLVTADEIVDWQNLGLWLEVNGRRHQNGSTSRMIFGVPHLVSYLTRFMSLQPGDVIATGTPPGVGHGMKPPVYLRPGDEVRLGIEGLGEQRQHVVAHDAAPASARTGEQPAYR